jgi:hypothetical protein
MHLIIASGPLSIRITPFRNSESRWFVVDAIADFTFTNAGARPGLIYDLRLKAEYPKLPIPNAHEYFALDYEVDPRKFEEHAQNRLEWTQKAAIGDGAETILLPRQSQSKRLVFSRRWESPVIQQLIVLTLEVYSDDLRKWKAYDSWKPSLTEKTWVWMANHRGCLVTDTDSRPSFADEANPNDLHEYTGPEKELTQEIPWSEPSYLDYRDDDDAGHIAD